MTSQRWRKIRSSRYILHIILGNSFGREGPFAHTDRAKLTTCKRVVILLYSGITSHLGLLLILLIHTFVGAAIFQVIEGRTNRESDKSMMESYRRELVQNILNDLIDNNLISTQNETQTILETHLGDHQDWLEDKSMLYLWPSAKSLWDFWGSMYYCCTIYTTIGYGNLFPVTTLGRWITIVYALIGIPLFLITVADLGLLLTKIVLAIKRWVSKNCCKKKVDSEEQPNNTASSYNASRRKSVADVHALPHLSLPSQPTNRQVTAQPPNTAVRHAKGFINRTASQAKLTNLVIEDDAFNDVVGQKLNETSSEHVPFYIPLLITLIYALCIAGVLMQWEAWTFTEAFYFIFISFSTIGFGDITPVHRNNFMAVSVLILVGLVLVAMVTNVLIRLVNDSLGKAKEKVDEIAEKKLGVPISERRISGMNICVDHRPENDFRNQTLTEEPI